MAHLFLDGIVQTLGWTTLVGIVGISIYLFFRVYGWKFHTVVPKNREVAPEPSLVATRLVAEMVDRYPLNPEDPFCSIYDVSVRLTRGLGYRVVVLRQGNNVMSQEWRVVYDLLTVRAWRMLEQYAADRIVSIRSDQSLD